MNPKFWGPEAWIFLHSITMNYPKNPTEKDRQVYTTFFNALQNILPCEKCAYNYSRNLQEHPIEEALDNRDSMVQWLITIHNEVNKETGKELYTYDQVIEKYNYKMMNLQTDPTMIYKVIIVCLVMIVVFMCKFAKKLW